MSLSDEMNFQMQIASVLDSLAKVAAVEITKLFESRLLASGTTVLIQRQNELNETLLTADTVKKYVNKSIRSIGIQVHEETTTFPELPDPKLYSSLDVGSNSLNDVGDSPGPGSPTNTEPVEVISTAPVDSSHLICSPAKLKPQPVKTEPRDGKSKKRLSKVCQMVPKPEEQDSTPQKECIDTPVQVEPHQASVSTAKGTAYSSSSTDAALAHIQAGSKEQSVEVWDHFSVIMKNKRVAFKLGKKKVALKLGKNKKRKVDLKQTPKEQKLTRACSVQLVNLLSGPKGKNSGGKAASPGSCTNNKRYPLPKDLKIHQGLHTGRRLCCFTHCGNGIWRLQGVLSPSRAHGCKICGKRFKRRKILRRHERFHTGEKPYSCSKCSKMFALRKSLRRHERFHTGDKPHSCTQCGKCFRLRDNLKAHLRFHTGERPFTCPLCLKSFRIFRNLEQHSHCTRTSHTKPQNRGLTSDDKGRVQDG
ncbi:hypothetical protein DPEC_G00061820 [Dallia pectoralis]|uniref:Uncharacterized protein n=1 Tax=Dallia pectoralis TaxID=75939 RepID=A0ACC2H7S5_DALPE|nr:hypothetical protein DPEC_G00061820 [Dallia pectoralis]